ncbi:MAG: hypothetical protein IKU01_01625 [Bacteroidales bacterium]|nr:hypothetical protein [Bacteroidales bacterium]
MEFNKPYKITLWEDETSYLVRRGGQDIVVTEPLPSDTIRNTWNSENCIAIIGSDTMDTPIRAFDPELKLEINGKKTLTFSIAFKYWDYEDEEFKQNPFINLLVNERRVKLFYDDEWHEFVIKQKEENSEKYIFSYTCEDIYLTELGRNGYEVELNTELENNLGTAVQLGEKILAESDWEVAPIGNGENDSDAIIQTTKEGLYLYTITSSITAKCLQDFEYDGVTVQKDETRTIPANSTIYIFYSSFINKENPIQFFFVDDSHYALDDHGFIINSPNWSYTAGNLPSFYGTTAALLDELQLNMSSYFGKKIYNMQESIYLTEIDKYCTSYMKNNTKYYCYKETEYASIAEIQNLLVNTEAFLETNGWGSYNDDINVYLPTAGGLNGQMSLQMDLTPGWVAYESFEAAQTAHAAGKRVYYISNERYMLVRPTETLVSGTTYYKNETCYNTGFFNNRKLLTEMVASDEDTFVLMLQMDSADDPTLAAVRAAVYAEEVDEHGAANDLLIEFTGPGTVDQEGYLTLFGKVRRTISYTNLVDTYTNITFYLYGNGTYSMSKALCFKKLLDANGDLIIPDLQTTADTIIREKYYFFTASQIDNTINSVGDLEYTAIQYNDNGFTPYYPSSTEKITMIEGSKSNYFNLIQTICEKFECWAKFIVEHDDYGAILTYYELTEDTTRKEGKTYYSFITGTPQSEDYYDNEKWIINTSSSVSGLYERKASKKVAFKEYVGKDNPVGFRYGINLKSIVRSVISDEITTKLIVEQNSNEFAKDGSCSIQKAALNPSGENMIFNFQYFINHGLIDEVELNKDLYGSADKTGIALLPNLHNINKILADVTTEKAELKFAFESVDNSLLILENQDSEAQEALSKLVQDIEATGYSNYTPEELAKFEYLRDLVTKQQYNNAVIDTYDEILANLKDLYVAYGSRLEYLTDQFNSYNEQKRALTKEFYKKYSKYIREGTWISEDYYDEDLYYLDAQMVLYTSAFPQTKYTINVVEISEIEEYEPYVFSIGDKTYMEDTEFFGWDSKGRPYKEEIVISKVSYNLDDPSKNTIEVQNYKTQFEDLFQRIAAETQSLQYHSGEYARAANAISQDYILDGVLMQNSLKNNELVIQNALNQAVVWDDSGISISNSRNPNEIVRLTSNGIVLTKDGGQTWETGITANGINADVITAGRLDTNSIRIFNGERQTFQWNSTGINAYAQNSSTQQVDYNTFVRFDQYGLYGLTADADWNPDTPTGNPSLSGLAKVKRDAYFSLTWDGLKIKLPNSGVNNEVINVNDKFIVYGDGSIKATNGEFTGTVYATNGTFSGTLSAAKVSGALTAAAVGGGWIEGVGIRVAPDDNDPPYYNFYVGSNGEVKAGGDVTNGPNFHVDTNGNVTIKGNVTLDSNSVIQWDNLSSQAQGYITDAQADATQALNDAGDALAAVEDSIQSSVQVWYAKATSSAPSKPTSEVTSTSTSGDGWRLVMPTYSTSYPHYFYCYQQLRGDGEYQWTNVVYDRAASGVYALAHGDFVGAGTTFISGETIYSPYIIGGMLMATDNSNYYTVMQNNRLEFYNTNVYSNNPLGWIQAGTSTNSALNIVSQYNITISTPSTITFSAANIVGLPATTAVFG